MPPVQYRSQVMDHLGLVAGMCKEPGIIDHIDKRAPKLSDEWNISHGEAVVAMIINGLGFTGQSLHMFPQFFANKPLDKLIRDGIEPEHINDKVLGRALDTLFDMDVSKVYFELAIKVVRHLKLPCDALNLDGTGFHVDGRYELKRQSRTFLDMKKKPAQNPKDRWVFCCFEGIHVWTINGTEKHVVGITENQTTIIFILGHTYQSINLFLIGVVNDGLISNMNFFLIEYCQILIFLQFKVYVCLFQSLTQTVFFKITNW